MPILSSPARRAAIRTYAYFAGNRLPTCARRAWRDARGRAGHRVVRAARRGKAARAGRIGVHHAVDLQPGQRQARGLRPAGGRAERRRPRSVQPSLRAAPAGALPRLPGRQDHAAHQRLCAVRALPAQRALQRLLPAHPYRPRDGAARVRARRLAGELRPQPHAPRFQRPRAHPARLAAPSHGAGLSKNRFFKPADRARGRGAALGSGGQERRADRRDPGASPRTVQKHLQRVYEKLGVEGRTAAAMRLLVRP